MELFDSKRQERMQAVIIEITASKENAIKFLKEAGSPHALISLTYTSSAVYGNKLRFTTRDVILQFGNLLFSSDDVLFVRQRGFESS